MRTPAFELRDISIRPTPESDITSVSLRVSSGSPVAMQGPSGCGKTTLLRTLVKLQPPERGEVYLNDRSWTSFTPREWRRKIALVPSRPRLFPGTAWENLVFPFNLKISGSTPFPERRARELAATLQLSDKVLQRETHLLSDGEKSRIALLRALLVSPAVLLADEPTAALDSTTQDALLGLLLEFSNKEGLALLVVAHDEKVAEKLKAETHCPWGDGS